MKFLPSQLMYLLDESEARQNLRALGKFAAVLVGTVGLFTVLFHVIMDYEGQTEHSWLTGLYWTLTVMSTLGFGDITFHTDIGRFFTIVVLVYGIVMLLIVAPFTFIRFFYAPWLEAQVRMRAPREVPAGLGGHVILAKYDEMVEGLIRRLAKLDIGYVVVEPDPAVAARLHGEGVHVVCGPRYQSQTYEAAKASTANLVVANLGDAANSNVTLTVREIAPYVPIAALASEPNSVDVLQLSGATRVLLLKKQLGEQLATRVGVATQVAHRIGRFEDLIIAEFPVTGTALVGRTIRESHLRQLTGLNIVAMWERGRMVPTDPDTVLTKHCVPIVVGTEEQITELDALFVIYQDLDAPVIVIGGGTVGRAVAASLRAREAKVTMLEQDAGLKEELESIADRVVIGDAANLGTVKSAGIESASSVVLTTNDDATNIFLAIYCRKLNPSIHIVSRITNDWNLEAIHRAGTDSALSHESVAVQTLLSQIMGNDLVVMGEETEVFFEPVPERLAGVALADSKIGGETGLAVVAIRENGTMVSNPAGSTVLEAGAELVLIGNTDQRQRFQEFAAAV